MADLQVTVGADISQYKTNMAQAGQVAVQTTGAINNSLNSTASQFTQTGAAAQSMSMRFMQMRSGLSAARDGMMGLTLSGQAADRSLMAMGHHFSSLIGETGSVGGAFKALGNSLMGAGGLILGLTLAYELFKHFSKGAKEAADSGKDYVDTLDGITSATIKGEQAGASETTRLKILYDATQNHKLSLKDRNLAYDELMNKYPAYFTAAEREKTLLGENAAGYYQLSKAILAAAQAKAYENQIGENSNKLFESANQRANLEGQKGAAVGGYKNELAGLRSSYPGIKDDELKVLYADRLVGYLDTIKEIQTQINEKKANELKLTQDNTKLLAMATSKEAQAGFKTEPGGKTGGKTKEAVTGLDLMKQHLAELKTAWDDAAADGKPFAYLQKMAAAYERMAQKIADVEEKIRKSSFAGGGAPALDDAKSVGVTTPELTNQGQDIEAEVKRHKELQDAIFASRAKGAQWKQELKDENSLLKEVSRTIGTGLTQAFESALSGSQNFFQAMGQFLTRLIERLIATAAAAVILAAVISIATGGSVDAAGVSQAISFGDAFKSSFSDISGIGRHATGGIFTQPRVGMFAEAGPEAIVTPQHLADFAGVQSGGMGGTLTMKLQGSDMLLFLDRAQKSQSRKS